MAAAVHAFPIPAVLAEVTAVLQAATLRITIMVHQIHQVLPILPEAAGGIVTTTTIPGGAAMTHGIHPIGTGIPEAAGIQAIPTGIRIGDLLSLI